MKTTNILLMVLIGVIVAGITIALVIFEPWHWSIGNKTVDV